MEQFIYVVETEHGHMKIGRSRNPERRAKAITQHSPVPCRLIAVWPGTNRDESALLARFSAARAHGEWFLPCAETRAFCDSVRGANVLDIAPWSELSAVAFGERRRRGWEKGAATRRLRAAARREIAA